MTYFTSDWHLGEDRLGGDNGKPNLFYRPWKHTIYSDANILKSLDRSLQDGDVVWHLGDVFVNYTPYNQNTLLQIKEKYPNTKFKLILGNYDEGKTAELEKYFDEIYDMGFVEIGENSVYLNHYPKECVSAMSRDTNIDFSITGHIHGLWKVQPKMINVGVDAWHFSPVSEDEIKFCWNAMQKFYDENVFPYGK